MDADARWSELTTAWLARPGIGTKKMLQAEGLAGPNGKVFATFVDGEVVVKLPAEMVDGLVEHHIGRRFRSGNRPMEEWASIGEDHAYLWTGLMEEAHLFVNGAPAPPTQAFTAVVTADARRRVIVPVPFDPDEAWGRRKEHHVAGTVNGMAVRAVLEPIDDGYAVFLGPAWRRDCGMAPGDHVSVLLTPEGPQRGDLAADFAEALEASPEAAACWDSIAQFYRRAYLRWIDATKRRPDERARRIAETVHLLAAGHKERPRS